MLQTVVFSTLLATVAPVQAEVASTDPAATEPALASENPPEVTVDRDSDDDAGRDSFRWQRAAIDLGAAMALGAAWYQSEIELNKEDFDFDRSFREQARRLTTSDGYRFDDNARFLNVGHSFVGSYYHLFARANGGSMLQAMLFDFTASSVWELGVEHREVVSVNDTIITSLGGVAFGESLFRMGELFARSRPTVANRVLMSAFSPARAIAWMYGDAPRPSAAGFDEHGLAVDAHHRFALSVGGVAPIQTTAAGAPGWHGAAAIDLELVDLPEHGRAGQSQRALSGGEMTRVAVEYAGDHRDMQAMTLRARSSMWGKYRQDIDGAGSSLDGYSAFWGTSTAFDLSYHDFGDVTDFSMAVHLLGPSADVTLHRSRWRLRVAADLFPDFAMMRPLALDDAGERAPDLPGPSTLAHDYYFAFGVTAAARAEAGYRRARAGAAMEWSGYDGIEGLDRHQKEYTSPTGVHHDAIMDDPAMADRRLKLRLYTETPLPFSELALGASLDYLQRVGTATGATRAHDDLRLSFHATCAL